MTSFNSRLEQFKNNAEVYNNLCSIKLEILQKNFHLFPFSSLSFPFPFSQSSFSIEKYFYQDKLNCMHCTVHTSKDLYIYIFAFGEYNSKQVNVSDIQHFLAQFKGLELRTENSNATNIYLFGIIFTKCNYINRSFHLVVMIFGKSTPPPQ